MEYAYLVNQKVLDTVKSLRVKVKNEMIFLDKLICFTES